MTSGLAYKLTVKDKFRDKFLFYVFRFTNSFKYTYPVIPEIREASRTANLELTITDASSKARRVMKIDIVKPIPARIPAPAICLKFRSEGKFPSPDFIAMKLKIRIPAGFPKDNPAMIPRLFEENISLYHPEEKIIPVFARANKGSTMNDTGFIKECSSFTDGDSPFVFLKGIANASSTPVMVG